MLIAKINPPAKKVIEVTPFTTTTEDLDYMTAIARPYIPGAEKTNFQVQFGTLILNDEGTPERFVNQNNTQITLTSEELTTWGTNDEVLLNLVSEKLGVEVLEFINISQDFI
jgi:hypothetical protein